VYLKLLGKRRVKKEALALGIDLFDQPFNHCNGLYEKAGEKVAEYMRIF